MNNVKRFDALTAMIFADLYESFPVKRKIKPESYLGELIDENDFSGSWSFGEFFDSTVSWLDKCEYIYLEKKAKYGGSPEYSAVLAPRAFDVMRRVSPLENEKTIGEEFRKVVEEKSWKGIGIIVSSALSGATNAVVKAVLS